MGEHLKSDEEKSMQRRNPKGGKASELLLEIKDQMQEMKQNLESIEENIAPHTQEKKDEPSHIKEFRESEVVPKWRHSH